MKLQDVMRLIALGAIWGSSHLFMRILAPVLGPCFTANIRVFIAGGVLVSYFMLAGHSLNWRLHWKHYLLLGIINFALPFSLYCFAALHIPASYSVIFESTAPLFGTLLAAFVLNERITWNRALGLIVGISGVTLVAHAGSVHATDMLLAAIVACLAGALCLALASIYIKIFARHVAPESIAAGSLFMAGLALVPCTLSMHPLPALSAFTLPICMAIAALSLLCTALAYMLYYQLITHIGPVRALTVTFLIPIFGMLWGILFLGETVTVPMLFGCGLIMCGAAFIILRD